MKIAVWRTGHEIADTVAEAVYEGLKRTNNEIILRSTNSINEIDSYDCHVAYGILRGTSEVFKQAEEKGKLWFNIDRGYWKPGHYDGYYRVSLGGTQQTVGLDRLEPDYERWDKLDIGIVPYVDVGNNGYNLYCPPTDYVANYFNVNSWLDYEIDTVSPHRIRQKDSLNELQLDFDGANKLTTFNSSVGWEALRQGIPVISDPIHSIVGSYQKLMDKPLHLDYEGRRRLFAIQASLQLTLSEMREGKLWPLLNRLLATSAGIQEKV